MARKWLVGTLAVAALAAASAGSARAQVFTPTFQSPRLTNDIGVYLSDSDPGDLSLEGIWRGGPFGLRVGLVDAGDDLLSIGGELRSPLLLAGAPVSLAFTAGAQALIGDAEAFGVQGGLSAGYTFNSPGLAVTPYIHPRIGLINGLPEDDDLEVEVMADLGVDVEFAPRFILRFGANLGDVGADWGIGLAWRQ
ncbi:MAG TPA: hypothetical protein VGV85_17580 [Longimicrobiaceae bacterium]|nr:hypothetical protein [Longimicrobiaceae bacterium]